MADSENIKNACQELEDELAYAEATAQSLLDITALSGTDEPPWIAMYAGTVKRINAAAAALMDAIHEDSGTELETD